MQGDALNGYFPLVLCTTTYSTECCLLFSEITFIDNCTIVRSNSDFKKSQSHAKTNSCNTTTENVSLSRANNLWCVIAHCSLFLLPWRISQTSTSVPPLPATMTEPAMTLSTASRAPANQATRAGPVQQVMLGHWILWSSKNQAQWLEH